MATPAEPPPRPTVLPLPAWLERGEVLPPLRPADPAGPLVTTTPANPVQDWRDLVIDQSADKLGTALQAAGRSRPAPGYVPHHIVLVEGGGADMAAARQRLADLGIDIDHEANGVWLPSHRAAPGAEGAYHNRLHNGLYFDAVATALFGAQSRDDALDVLRRIGRQLGTGDHPGVRDRPPPKGIQP
jgi:hypothetical protein